jgi:uncharacterized protein with FMN-binding domain
MIISAVSMTASPRRKNASKKPRREAGGPSKKIANSLVALSSAAVLTVYAAGYLRTRAAAERFAVAAAQRRPVVPAPASGATPAVLTPGAPLAVSAASAPKSVAGVPSSWTVSPAPAPTPTSTTITNAAPVPAPVEGSTPTISAEPAAVPPPEPAAAATVAEQVQYKDGTYLGWGSCRHGDIQASVVVEGGRIAAADIAQCLTRYSCSAIAPLIPQVASRQGANIDYVSGATESSDAFYYAILDALSKAK